MVPIAADAGSVFIRLGAIFERKGFEEYERADKKARSKRPIETKVGAALDQSSFRTVEQKIDNLSRKARERFTVKGRVEVETRNAERKLDAVIKEANQLDRELRKQKAVNVNTAVTRRSFGGFAQGVALPLQKVSLEDLSQTGGQRVRRLQVDRRSDERRAFEDLRAAFGLSVPGVAVDSGAVVAYPACQRNCTARALPPGA